jgi:CRP-like cAMP-binding protein
MITLPKEFISHKKPQLFENLSESALQYLLQHSVMKNYDADQLLVQQGDTAESLIFLIEGSIRTFRISEAGAEATIRMLSPGDTCMEAVLFMSGTSPVNVQTMSAAQVVEIPKRIVKTLTLENSQFSYNLLRIVTRHYKNAMHQVEAINTKVPLQRIGYYFLEKHIEQGHENLELKLSYKKQDVANYLGMTPETFSRALKKMQDMGITIEDDKILMRDSFALCHFCDSDTAASCPRSGGEDCPHCPLQ